MHSFPRQKRPPSERPLGSSLRGGDESCLEATLVVRPGDQPRVRLAQLSWGEGVGWYSQHSLELNLDEVHELARLLERVPNQVESEPAAEVPVSLAAYRARKAGRR